MKGARIWFWMMFTGGLAASEAAAQFLVGPNINISKATGYQAETAIAINPTNPLNLFTFANQQTASTGFLLGAVSNDGGLTWATRTLATGSDSLTASCCDPSGAFDQFGNLFITYLDTTDTKTIVGLSTNGGSSFSTLASFTVAVGVDQPTLSIGPSGTSAASSVWVTYTDFNANAIVARGAAVNGAGAANVGAFSAAQTAPTSSNSGFGDLAIGPTGKVAVTYQNPSDSTGPSNILVSVDANGLNSGGFSSAVTATSTNVGGFRPITPQPNRTIDAETSLAWDRSGGVHNGRLYMVYTDAASTNTNDTNIFLRFSDNDGATWSARTQLNTDGTTNSQFFCKAAVDPVTGDLAVVWYDARNDPANTKVELWATASVDGGQTFLPNTKVSLGASNGTQANIANGNEFGDYLGLTIFNGTFYPVWGDSSNSTLDNPDGTTSLDIYTARVTIIPEASMWALLLGGMAMLGCARRLHRARKADA